MVYCVCLVCGSATITSHAMPRYLLSIAFHCRRCCCLLFLSLFRPEHKTKQIAIMYDEQILHPFLFSTPFFFAMQFVCKWIWPLVLPKIPTIISIIMYMFTFFLFISYHLNWCEKKRKIRSRRGHIYVVWRSFFINQIPASGLGRSLPGLMFAIMSLTLPPTAVRSVILYQYGANQDKRIVLPPPGAHAVRPHPS